MNNYTFLICENNEKQSLYANGVPIGDIIKGIFYPHCLDKENQIAIKFENIGGTNRVPFKSLHDFKQHLIKIVEAIDLNISNPDEIKLARPIIQYEYDMFGRAVVSDDEIQLKLKDLREALRTGRIIDIFDQKLIVKLREVGVKIE